MITEIIWFLAWPLVIAVSFFFVKWLTARFGEGRE